MVLRFETGNMEDHILHFLTPPVKVREELTKFPSQCLGNSPALPLHVLDLL